MGSEMRAEARHVVVEEAVESGHVPGGEAIFNVGRIGGKRHRHVQVHVRRGGLGARERRGERRIYSRY